MSQVPGHQPSSLDRHVPPLTETVNLDDLTRYAALETDRRLPLLRSYLRRQCFCRRTTRFHVIVEG